LVVIVVREGIGKKKAPSVKILSGLESHLAGRCCGGLGFVRETMGFLKGNDEKPHSAVWCVQQMKLMGISYTAFGSQSDGLKVCISPEARSHGIHLTWLAGHITFGGGFRELWSIDCPVD
jgi:hypothetical protein